MSLNISQTNLNRNNLRQLFPMPRTKIWPYYDTGGEVIYYDDFSDGIMRGANNDDSAWSPGGIFAGGVTGITTVASYAGRVLRIRPPYLAPAGPFQDYNIGMMLTDDPSGSGTDPIIGMECKIGISGTSHFLGLAVERFDEVFTTNPRSKYEARIEYKASNNVWRQVYDTTGSGGGVPGSTSGTFFQNYFTQILPANIGNSGEAGWQEVNWVPIKIIVDTSALTYSGSLQVGAGTKILGSLRVADKYTQLIKPPTNYQFTQSPTIANKYYKIEIHCGTDTDNAWTDFYFADWILTREFSI